MTFSLFFFQAEDGIRDVAVTGVQTCALPISYVAATARNRLQYHQLGLPLVHGAGPLRCTSDGCAIRHARWGGRQGDSPPNRDGSRSEEHTSELQSRLHLVCRLLLEKKKKHIR